MQYPFICWAGIFSTKRIAFERKEGTASMEGYKHFNYMASLLMVMIVMVIYIFNPKRKTNEMDGKLILEIMIYVILWQDIVTEWGKKPDNEKDFNAFHKAMQAAAFYQRGQLKYKVNMLQTVCN